MVERTRYEFIKTKYGYCASWAIWADAGKKPKENVGDLRIFDEDQETCLLHRLNPEIIFVGLNISRKIELSWANFHDGRSQSQDYKIRYALKETPFWGAYMTDIIKDFEQKVSGEIMRYLRANKAFEDENAQMFREEMKDIGANHPTLVAFGRNAYSILIRNFGDSFKILKIPHYSSYLGKEKYREEVNSVLRLK
jgi:hypothetical protein